MDIQYIPAVGKLPGRSFEEQTVDFFKAIQESLELLQRQFSQLQRDTTGELAILRTQVGEINDSLTSLQSLIATAQGTADSAVTIANNAAQKAQVAVEGSVPKSGVILMRGATPEGWDVADGNNGTIDLSAYTDTTDIVYIQRKAV